MTFALMCMAVLALVGATSQKALMALWLYLLASVAFAALAALA